MYVYTFLGKEVHNKEDEDIEVTFKEVNFISLLFALFLEFWEIFWQNCIRMCNQINEGLSCIMRVISVAMVRRLCWY